MGNCLKCFQSTSEHPSNTLGSGVATSSSMHSGCHPTTHIVDGRYTGLAATTATTNINANDGNHQQLPHHLHVVRATFSSKERSHETDELLSTRSPLKPANHCDTKRSSFKKSLALLNGNASTMCDIITAVKETSEVSDNTLNKLFEEYKEPDEDMILADGIERLCCDLNYQPDEFAILVLAWCLDASQMCRFTRSEFIEGLHKMRADTIETIRIRLEQTIETLKVDSEMFKQLYRFTFRFGLEPDQRILSLDMAISLWKLVFTVHTPDLLSKWIHFLEQHPSIRGIPKDTWNMFLNFSEQCDINNYDDTEAWPSLFDDFVDYEKSRLETGDDDNNNDDPLQQKQMQDNSSSINVL
ncbi:DCN1-like protein 3 [Musca domestica]|uniref:Defective in cullin neddylation protein n=1 Tax=Musca domestica TaxID=7370 RepID=A0A1I8M9A5_MUSDO|nr:DCN1-like protein 3 [Musca domestica]